MTATNLRALKISAGVAALCAAQIAWADAPQNIEARLKERNIVLPKAPVASGNYVDAVRVGNLLFMAGYTSRDGAPKGKVGQELTVEQGYQAARYAGLLFLARVQAAVGGLDRVKRVVKATGIVSSSDGFGEQPKVMNGFSDLMVEVFGDVVGKHARTAFGVSALPGNAPIEVEAILEVE